MRQQSLMISRPVERRIEPVWVVLRTQLRCQYRRSGTVAAAKVEGRHNEVTVQLQGKRERSVHHASTRCSVADEFSGADAAGDRDVHAAPSFTGAAAVAYSEGRGHGARASSTGGAATSGGAATTAADLRDRITDRQ